LHGQKILGRRRRDAEVLTFVNTYLVLVLAGKNTFAPSLSQSGSRFNRSATRDAAARTSLEATTTASTSPVVLRVS
jgi:hypothetical protein